MLCQGTSRRESLITPEPVEEVKLPEPTKPIEPVKPLVEGTREYFEAMLVPALKQYVKDRKDLRMIVSLIKKGNLVMAGRKAWLLDTIVREQIPNKIFNIIDSAWIK